MNNGSGGFGPKQVISNLVDNLNYIAASDLDSDGDMDVISVSIGDSKLAWYENSGNGTFGAQQMIATINNPSKIFIADIDLDNDQDIIIVKNYYGKILWFENNGIGNFSSSKLICDSLDYPCAIHVIDLDNDLDLDVIYNSSNPDKIFWSENKGYLAYDSVSVCEYETYTFGSQLLTTPGYYIDTMQTIFGLDSVVALDLFHIPLPNVSISPFPQDTFCIQTGLIDLPIANPTGGSYVGSGITGVNIDLNITGEGLHNLSYFYTDTTSGCSNSDTIQILVVNCMSVEEDKTLKILVFPNPSKGLVTIGGLEQSGIIFLYNNTGKEILNQKIVGHSQQINLSQLKPGMYYLHVTTETKIVSYKLMKI